MIFPYRALFLCAHRDRSQSWPSLSVMAESSSAILREMPSVFSRVSITSSAMLENFRMSSLPEAISPSGIPTDMTPDSLADSARVIASLRLDNNILAPYIGVILL